MKSLVNAAIAALFCIPSANAQPINVVLSLSERVPLAELAANVTDPTSDRYGRYYTPEEIRALAAPTDDQYATLLESLRADGFEIVSESTSHLSVTIRGEHSLFAAVFATPMRFRTAMVHESLAAATIPAKYSIVKSVRGLDNTRRRHHHMVFNREQLSLRKGKAPTQGGILPAQIKTAYGFDSIYKSGWTGKGQHIAVATYDGFHIEDVKAYYRMEALAPGPTVDQVTFNGTPRYDDDSAAETQLDAEFSGMIAPGAAIHVFASAENSDAGELAMFTAILDDNRAKIVNYSWGVCETGLDPSHKSDMDAIYARAVAQGINIMVASGDSGSDGCGDGSTAADWPASSPNVVAIGGTSLKVAKDNSIQSETGWGYVSSQTGGQEGSGGGVSELYALPTWQKGIPGVLKKRSFPDVAFNADPKTGEAIWTHLKSSTAHWFTLGGTSMAAPQWSGFLALVNEARASKGQSTLGYLNPLIYGTEGAKGSNAELFHDITSGSNGAYESGAGWDAVTGLGSLQADALLTYLASQ